MDKKVIFIDWHGTLSCSMFWEDLQLSHPDIFEQIQRILFKADNTIIMDWMRGELSVNDVLDYLVDNGIKDRSLIEISLQESCKNITFIDPHNLKLIQKLRSQGYLCVLATDNMDVFSKYTVPAYRLDTYFDDIINSSHVGALKKEYDEKEEFLFFSKFLKKHNLDISQAVLIDDNVKDQNHFEQMGLSFLPVNAVYSLRTHLEDICLNKRKGFPYKKLNTI